jgi:cyclopropane-fatty-acyl-phospholipid synthase
MKKTGSGSGGFLLGIGKGLDMKQEKADDLAPAARGSGDSAELSIEGRLMRALLRSMGEPPVRIGLWNGDVVGCASGNEVAQMQIADRKSLLKLVFDPEFQFGECFSEGTLKVKGDLVRLLSVLMRALSDHTTSLRRFIDWVRHRRSNSLNDSRDNIHAHYDLGNTFYQLWLDPKLAYTCAYFPTPRATLAEAQIAKMDLVCRKMRLQPGEAVVEAGCGWGALALHMAANYGVKVKAYNISREQLAYARERASVEGLGDRVEFVEDDYRNIRGEFDAFVSVGMLEHVGHDNYTELSRVIDRVLAPNGRGLIHSIGLVRPAPLNAWIERRIFPGANPPSLRQMLEIMEGPGFSVLDVENLRLHYALTLKYWRENYEAAIDTVREMYGERFTRIWSVYLSGSQAAFESGQLQLFQVVFARQHTNDVPWTRAHLYEQ